MKIKNMFFNDTFNGVGLLLKAGEFGLRLLLSQLLLSFECKKNFPPVKNVKVLPRRLLPSEKSSDNPHIF